MGVNKRIAVRCSILPSLDLSQRQKDVLPGPKQHPQSAWVHGTIASGTSTTSYNVKMDAPFPSDDNVVVLVARNKNHNDVRAIHSSHEERPLNKANRCDEEQRRLEQLGMSDDGDDEENASTGNK